MPSSSTSRLPVEIWQRILRFVILGLYILKPDPYDVPSSLLLNVPLRTDLPKESYKDYISQVENMRRVCKSWNSFSNSLLDAVVSLENRSNYSQSITNEEAKRFSRAIKITQRSCPPICGCRFGHYCPACRMWPRSNSKQIHSMRETFRAQIMDVLDDDILQFALNLSERFPSLISVNLVHNKAFLPSLLTFFARFSTLVLLRIRLNGSGEADIPLDLPNLRSLEISVGGELIILRWKLPSLRCFHHKSGPTRIEDLIYTLKEIAPNLTFLSLPYGSTFSPELQSDIWEILPNLVVLGCPIDFLLANPPPVSHPLQQFRMIEIYDNLEGVQQEKLLKAMETGSNLHSIMGNFDWSKDFERVMGTSRDAEPRPIASQRRSRLSLGLELKYLGAKYQDKYGLDFTEACDRFGGDSPLFSIQDYVSGVTIREQSPSPSDSS